MIFSFSGVFYIKKINNIEFQTNHLKCGKERFDLYQFSSVPLLSHVRLFVTPWTAARQASLSITNPRVYSKVKVKSLSRVRLFATPWTVAHQASPSMGFSRQEYWSGLPVPSPRDLADSSQPRDRTQVSRIAGRRFNLWATIELVMPSNYLILCHPLLFPPSIFSSIRVFSNESAVCIR